MSIQIKKIIVENFKAYYGKHEVKLSDISVLIGANSSGKSSIIQALLVLKQTVENPTSGWDLLLSGKYVALGTFDEIINSSSKDYFTIGISIEDASNINELSQNGEIQLLWYFIKDSNYRAETKLHKIVIRTESNTLELNMTSKNKFEVQFDMNKVSYDIILDGLQISKIAYGYSNKLNEYIVNSLNELINLIRASSKHKYRISKTDDVIKFGFYKCYEASNDLFVTKTENELKQKKRTTKLKETDNHDLINHYFDQMKVLMRFLNNEYFELLSEDDGYFTRITSYIIPQIVDLNRFNTELNNIISKDELFIKSFDPEEFKVDNFFKMNFDEASYLLNNQRSNDDKTYFNFLKIYQNAILNIFKKIYYVGPLRESPKGLYNYAFDSNPKYVGAKGEYFPFVLSNLNIRKEYFLPDNNKEKIDLSEALNDWCSHLKIASRIHVSAKNSFGVNIQVSNMMNKNADIMNVGIGTSQVLPVLISGLVSDKNDLLIFEQPELHLHPYSQSRLADFIIEASNSGRQIIIESHSEYMLQRFRYHIITKDIENENITLNFFKNDNDSTVVNTSYIDEYGDIEYPSDFKDQTQVLINELLGVALRGNR